MIEIISSSPEKKMLNETTYSFHFFKYLYKKDIKITVEQSFFYHHDYYRNVFDIIFFLVPIDWETNSGCEPAIGKQ